MPRESGQVLHGCRHCGVVNVGLSPATSATLSFVASGPAGNSKETASDKLRKVGMTSVMALRPYYTRATMAHTKRKARASGPHKVRRSPIEFATRPMKSESLVIVDQNATVNTFPGLTGHTARHTMEWVAKK